MNIEEMYVPTGLKTVDGKDIMGFNGAFYLQNKEKINKMLKKYADIIIEEDEEEKQRENKYILKENTEKYSINKKHDKMFKEILYDEKEMKKFIGEFIWYGFNEELELQNGEYITKFGSGKLVDILYKVKGQDIYFLIEHQTKIDYNMPFRMLEYSVEISRRAMKNMNKCHEEYKYPLIIPIVIYTGNRK